MNRFALVIAGFAILTGRAGAATYTVDRLDDAVDAMPADGLCVAVGGGCTLRAAVMEANATVTGDVITLPMGTLRLTLTSGPDDQSFGDVDLTQDVAITGGGMRETVIVAAPGERVFEFLGGSSFSLLNDLSVRGGVAAAGGGLLIHPPTQVSCENCLLTGNRSTGDGGGAYVLAGAFLGLGRSIIASNDAAGAGGGLHSAGALLLGDSRVTRNRAGGEGGGMNISGSINCSASTIDANLALGDGGGLTLDGGVAGLTNTTISGNRGARGGGLYVNSAASSSIFAVTVASNTALVEGGGVWVSSDSGISFFETLLGDNAAPVSPDCLDPAFENGRNLVEDASGCIGAATGSSNITGLDPELAPLSNYGGFTPTHELLSTASPAWNAATALCGVATDQRGHPRPLDDFCEIGAAEFYGVVPVALALDAPGNGLMEPNETALVAPTMGNLRASSITLTGQMQAFGGPEPAAFSYLRPDPNASYGSLVPGLAASCASTGNCYSLSVAPLAMAARPLRHWDGLAHENTSGPLEVRWRIHLGGSFPDVAPGAPNYREIESLLHHEATAGCSSENYCPEDPLSRRQLALLLERAYWGPFPLPFTATSQVFADVPLGDPHAPWIARLSADGVTSGCAPDPDGGGPLLPRFCPENPVRRDQLARQLVRMRLGPGFVPLACSTQTFEDVAIADPHCPWIRTAVLQGFMTGCAADPDGSGPLLARYCPGNGATRATAASALARTFALDVWSLGL